MKNILSVTLLVLIVVQCRLHAQSVEHPWWVVDHGGGTATAGGLALRTSIGQTAAGTSTHIDTGLIMQSGFVPGMRELSGTLMSASVALSPGWNLLSVPLEVEDWRKEVLFPEAASRVFAYRGSYVATDTLHRCTGYWVKFLSGHVRSMTGSGISSDTLDVRAGWNIIGGLSYPIVPTSLIPIAPVEIRSGIFRYNGGYQAADTLDVGRGFWVKVSHAGKLVLVSSSFITAPPGE